MLLPSAHLRQSLALRYGFTTMTHRRDIDGLRALAVLSVIFYHLDSRIAGAGFLGVDVFFAISGYLITSTILRDEQAGGFSLASFYERRVRRLFPALFAVITTFLVVGFFTMLPNEFGELARSAFATTLFASNFLFHSQANYFSSAAEAKPLLHTWSLAVEEQFYILFPLVLIFLRQRLRAALVLACLGVFALSSLALNIWLSQVDGAGAFYLPWARAWELLFGALLALNPSPLRPNRLAREAAALTGVLLIAGSLLLPDWGRRAPLIPEALWPCLGAVLVLYAGANGPTLAGRILGNPIASYVGIISYSLYLWHWPLIAFYRLLLKHDLRAVDKILLLLAIMVAGVLSERFIERPFRRSAPSAGAAKSQQALLAGAGVMAACLAVSGVVWASDGFVARFPAAVVKAESHLHYGDMPFFRTNTCFLSTDSNNLRFFSPSGCLSLDPTRKNILIVGDSHAAHLWQGLSATNPEVHFLQATVAGCSPVIGVTKASPFEPTCAALMAMIYDRYIPAHRLDGVIVAARWNDDEARAIGASIGYLRRFTDKVYVVGPTVEYLQPLPRLVAISLLKDDPGAVSAARRPVDMALEAQLRRGVEAAGGTYVSLRDALCVHDTCVVLTPHGVPVDFDGDHLSSDGSRFVAARWRSRGFPAVSVGGMD